MFPVHTENSSALPVHGRTGIAVQIGSVADDSIFGQGQTEIDAFPLISLNFRKQPASGLRIVPYVRTGPGATANPFPSPEAAILESIARCRGKRRGVGHGSIKQPVRQRGIVPALDPFPRLAGKTIEILGDVFRDLQCVGEPIGVPVADNLIRHLTNREVREMPGDGKRDNGFLAGESRNSRPTWPTNRLPRGCEEASVAFASFAVARSESFASSSTIAIVPKSCRESSGWGSRGRSVRTIGPHQHSPIRPRHGRRSGSVPWWP